MVALSGSQSQTFRQHGTLRSSPVTAKARLPKQDSRLAGEVIPDSEDDRRKASNSNEVIEVSSDEEDNLSGSASGTSDDPFLPIPGSWPMNQNSRVNTKEPAIHKNPRLIFQTIATPRRLYRAPRRVIESSGSEDSDAEGDITRASEVIELSDSSPEWPTAPREAELSSGKITARAAISSEDELFDSDREDDLKNDDSILILDEPRSARKPLRLPNLSKESSVPLKQFPGLTNDSEQSPTLVRDTSNPKETSRRPKALDTPLTPTIPMSTIRNPDSRSKGTSRLGKRAQAAAEQERRVVYAQKLFEELNGSVFGDKLPKETKLNWSKRLLTTAGRAKWHRSRDGVQTTEIELAEKILDCDERIRNTLSHEMCHLASWIIDARPKEVHGSIFKAWSNKVMRARPEIDITTKHNYEIGFKFNWKCLQCSKIYGRHSKSIDVTKVVCGACREGRLIALFETRASRNLKTPKTSKLAAAKPQDSLQSLPQTPTDVPTPPRPNASADRVVYVIHDSDSEQDAEIETLTTAMGSVTFIG